MKKSSRVIFDPTLVALKYIVTPIVHFLAKTPVTPNQVTVLNFLLFVPAASFLFFRGGFVGNMLAVGMLILYSLFDLVDGELARQKKLQSALGHWLDVNLDTILQTAIIFSIALNILVNMESNLRYLALLPLFGQGLANVGGMRLALEYNLDPFAGNRKLFKLFEKKRSLLDNFLKNMLVPSDFFYLFLFTLRFYILIGAVFNIMPYTFFVFGFFIVVRAVSIYAILGLHHVKPQFIKKYATLEYLEKNSR